MRILLALLFAAALSGCGPGKTQYYPHTLPSGKQIKVLGVGRMSSNDSPALMLKYQTDLRLDDKPALEKEAEEIWASFRADVDKAGLSNAIISANEPPTGFIVTHSRGVNFVYKKSADGQWSRLKS